MKTYPYKSYKEYLKSQLKGFEKKKSNQWAVEENIKFLAEYISPLIQPSSGICHGTRSGLEQRWFMKYLPGCYVIGTEIGDVIDEFTVQWDFNKYRPEWERHFDFVYSNSFDHAFNPEKTFSIWARQVKSGGLVILEYDRRNEHTGEISKSVNRIDPVSVTILELTRLIPKWVKGAEIKNILKMPVVTQQWRKAVIVGIP